jgi:hypothetical protein
LRLIVPNLMIGIDDILLAVSSFQGGAYPGDAPLSCP